MDPRKCLSNLVSMTLSALSARSGSPPVDLEKLTRPGLESQGRGGFFSVLFFRAVDQPPFSVSCEHGNLIIGLHALDFFSQMLELFDSPK